MNHAAVAGVVAALLTGPLQNAPPHPQFDTAITTERLESGELHAPGGNLIRYRIRLLPLASFPDLPPQVIAQMSQRRCMIPQTYEAQQPENVIDGDFRAPGSHDWAALCSAAGVTTLYVFFQGQYESPIKLRTQSDIAWLGAEPGSSVYSSAWGIALRSAAELRSSPQFHSIVDPNHDAIEDARLEHFTALHYYQQGKWLLIESSGTVEANSIPD